MKAATTSVDIVKRCRFLIRELQFKLSHIIFGNDVQVAYNIGGLLRTFPKMFSGSQLRKNGNLVFDEHIKINKNLIKSLVNRLDQDGVPSVTSSTETTARFNITLTDAEKE